MNIRKIVISDYEALYSLWISCKGMGLNDTDDSEAGIAKFLERNPETCFAAEESGNLIGAILAGNDGRRGYIYHLAVHPDYRRKGIAKMLTQAVLDALADLGIAKAALVVFAKNNDGNVFWEKMGFITRDDLNYRNKSLRELKRIDT